MRLMVCNRSYNPGICLPTVYIRCYTRVYASLRCITGYNRVYASLGVYLRVYSLPGCIASLVYICRYTSLPGVYMRVY